MLNKPIDAYFGARAPDNYERYFVPVIAAPLAHDLIEDAALRPGERVLDVACGTGIAARLAAERVGDEGTVAGSDLSPEMLAVAKASTPPSASITWYQTGAEAMPLSSEAFDVVLCQMGLQFFSNKLAALREMARVLAPRGRLALNVPGPTPDLLSIMADGLSRQLGDDVASFVHLVFSMHSADELRDLLEDAGFCNVDVKARHRTLPAPPPEEFMWQYISSTPLSQAVAKLDNQSRDSLERYVCDRWRQRMTGDAFELSVRVITAIAHKPAA